MPSYSSTCWLVAEFAARDGDVAGDRLVHLTEHVELLLVPAKALDDTVAELGDTSGDRGQPQATAPSR